MITKSTGGIHRITGFWFDGNSTLTDGGAGVYGIVIAGNTGSFRFDNNIYDIWRVNGFVFFDYVRGVLDHNTLNQRRHGFVAYIQHGYWNNNDNGCGIYATGFIFSANGCGDSSWAAADSMGTSEALFFEDNTITWNTSVFAFNFITDGWAGQRYVARFNTYQDAVWSDHGLDTSGRSLGARHAELYRSKGTFTQCGIASTIGYRGGTGRVFDVIITDTGGCLGTVGDLGVGVGDLNRGMFGPCGSTVWDGNQLSSGYRCAEQPGSGLHALMPQSATPTPIPLNPTLSPIYLWNNKKNGSLLGVNNVSPAWIAQNRDFYLDATSFDGTVGIGRGLRSARPATCTTGVAYWSTDGGGNWNTSTTETYSPGGPGEDGGLDKCVATNTWQNDWYVPFTYPHPLVTGGAIADATPPAKPANLT